MLKYFTMTVNAVIIAALTVGLLRGYAKSAAGRLGSIITNICCGLGLASAGVMAYMKNATRKIDTSLWNYRIFIASLAVLGLLIICSILRLAVPVFKGKLKTPASAVSAALAGGEITLAMFYALPDVLAYPYTLLLTEQTALSTDYLFKMIGMVLGLGLMLLAEMAMFRGCQRLGKVSGLVILYAGLLIYGLRLGGLLVKVMLNKSYILPNNPNYKTYFNITKFVSNNDVYFVYALLAVAVAMAVIIWVMSLRQREPYSNPAEKRKIIKKWRVSRRWADLGVFCTAMMLVSILVLEPYANRPVELSPVEDVDITDNCLYIPFEAVADGHLHRFGYVTPNGKHTRIIVIKKPGSSGYGIGLDACDICGETGYFERDGQVVCKLCDVVMNINTIGFPGGCNPIVVNYTVKDGAIWVPIEEMINHESVFKS